MTLYEGTVYCITVLQSVVQVHVVTVYNTSRKQQQRLRMGLLLVLICVSVCCAICDTADLSKEDVEYIQALIKKFGGKDFIEGLL